MASASSSSARQLFSDSKRRLSQRINMNTQNACSVARQVVRGSKTKEMMMGSAKNLAQAEWSIDNTMQALTKMELIRTHIGYQYQSIVEGTQKLEIVDEQLQALRR